MSNKAAFLEQTRAFCAALSEKLADFVVIDRTFAEFCQCVREVPESEFTGQPHEIIHRVRQLLSPRQTESGCLAEAFIEIWYCSNFAAATWYELVMVNVKYIRLAIEHAYLVVAFSGADGAMELAKLISQTGCIDCARPHLERIARRDDWGARWAVEVLEAKQSSPMDARMAKLMKD